MSANRNQYAVIFDSLGMSQIVTEFIYSIPPNISELSYDLCVFYSRGLPLYMTVPCPTITSMHLSKYNGVLITTSLETTQFALDNIFNHNKIYYLVYNLEWTYNPVLKDQARKVLSNSKIVLIARNKDHADKIKEDFGLEAKMAIGNCNFVEIVKGIENGKDSQKDQSVQSNRTV